VVVGTGQEVHKGNLVIGLSHRGELVFEVLVRDRGQVNRRGRQGQDLARNDPFCHQPGLLKQIGAHGRIDLEHRLPGNQHRDERQKSPSPQAAGHACSYGPGCLFVWNLFSF
jgi:hypothetical protein